MWSVLGQADAVERSELATLAIDTGFSVAVIFAVALLYVVTGRLLRWGLTRLARRAAKAAVPTRWKVRVPRLRNESLEVAELRRRQRIEATASGLGRLSGAMYVMFGILAIVHRFDIDVTFALTSAGFLGAVAAFGGQYHVQDYLTGLQVLLEDRYGTGDEIDVDISSSERVRGKVVWLGAFATRIECDGTTHHIANRFMNSVANHSQQGFSTMIHLKEPESGKASAADIGKAAHRVTSSLDTSSVVVVEDVIPRGEGDDLQWQVVLRGERQLADSEQDAIATEIQRRLS